MSKLELRNVSSARCPRDRKDFWFGVVRLCGMDAPEKDRSLGLESKQSWQRLL
ncbi:hypothetical protein [Pseudanabaena sp. PCC 6802]|uniref:hypothetical protein n=1 Tax=Pseudanabaena sp. PCC 6802 TaxID=118173 RepID=UPI000347FD01|nr:hypothetical protein [Pseudanabaena sp. PCC 6802]